MKKRIDVLLVDMGFFPSREQARRTIMAGNVFVDNQRVDKPGTMVKDDVEGQAPCLCEPWWIKARKGHEKF